MIGSSQSGDVLVQNEDALSNVHRRDHTASKETAAVAAVVHGIFDAQAT